MNDQPLGVIDSGIGGLSVVSALRRLLPSEDIIYLADPRNFPYGEKSAGELLRIVQPFFSFLLDECSVKLVVTACGSVSSTCLPVLSRQVPVPVMGIVEPGVADAVAVTRVKTIAVLATKATVHSGVFRQFIQTAGDEYRVVEQAWPELIEAVERGTYHTGYWFGKVKQELEILRSRGVDTVIMGCTHFSLISHFFEEAAEGRVSIVDPAMACARRVQSFLVESGQTGNGTGHTRLYVRGNLPGFRRALDLLNLLDCRSLERFPDRVGHELPEPTHSSSSPWKGIG